MSRRWAIVAAIAVSAALIGGAIGAAVTVLWRDSDETAIGQVVHVGGPSSLPGFPSTPWCNEFNHFCIAQTTPGNYVALYAFTTHSAFREQGCTVRWDTTTEYFDPATGLRRTGWFVDPCGGAAFDVTGHRVSGPAPRDLDRFSLRIENGEFLVDTRTLICGASPRPQPCPRAVSTE